VAGAHSGAERSIIEYMAYVQTKQDKAVGWLLLLCVIGFCFLLYQSLWWILSLPLYGLFSLGLCLFLVTGKLPETERLPRQKIRTKLFTPAGELKACTVCIYDSELIIQPGATVIRMEAISEIMFEDKSTDELDMAGFGIDYEDSMGSARVMFFNSGGGSVWLTQRMIKKIQTAHKKWFDGCRVDPLAVVDAGEPLRVYRALTVHRLG